jgi:hypothetical protein
MQKENIIKKIPNEFLKQISGGGNSGSSRNSFEHANNGNTGYGVQYTQQHTNGQGTVTGGHQGVQVGYRWNL